MQTWMMIAAVPPILVLGSLALYHANLNRRLKALGDRKRSK